MPFIFHPLIIHLFVANTAENNKRIAKNTLLLYFRMLLIIIVGLYTSRVVLNTLGVSDYGIYNVVGGIVAMLAFLNSAMVAASQRFISFELGTGNMEKLKKVFCTSVSIHIALAVIILLIAETLGLWFVNTHLNIPPERMEAANWVYQCSILTLLLTIVSVPYNSCIVAHEHMKAFAYVSIVEAVLKLLIVYLLLLGNFDKLIFYAILVVAVALIIRIIYGIYCKRNFEECTYHFVFDKHLFKEMFAFAGWSIIGNFGFALKDQGSNVILNLFFGTTVNAARGIALQVNGIISNFSNNLTMALNPQITKQYAAGDVDASVKLVYAGCRYSFYLLLLIAVPVMINIDYLLKLWLGTVPEHTSQFLMLALIAALLYSMASPLVTALQATGKIKIFQLTFCILTLSELPCVYWILINNEKPYYAMYPTIIITFIGLFIRLILLKRVVPIYKLRYFTINIVCRNLLTGSICFCFTQWIRNCLLDNFATFILTSLMAFCFSIIIIYIIGLSVNERHKCKYKFISYIHRHRRCIINNSKH